MAAAIRIFVNGTLAWSPQPGATNQPVTFKALKGPGGSQYFCFALLELQAVGGEVFATATPDRPDGVLTLYGPADDVHLTPEEKSPLGLLITLPRPAEGPPPLQGRAISFAFRDAAGNSLGSFSFQFSCRGSAEEALFRVKRGRLPELLGEQGRATGFVFEIETLQPATNAVGYRLDPWGVAAASFSHALLQTANRYQSPAGPLVEADYLAAPPGPGRDVFILTGTDAQGAEQSIPFISWLADTPARGELRIVGMDPDPAGRDAGAETITLQNVSARVLNVAGCYLEDEQRISFFGITLNLPHGPPGHQVLASRTLRPGEQLAVRPSFAMNNDFDAFTLRNRLGRKLDYAAYLRRLPGQPPPAAPRQRVMFRQTVSLTPWVETEGVSLPSALEDGDFVLIRPDPASRLWSGQIPHPATGPQGWLDASGQPVPAPAGWDMPLASAPVYALLLVSSPAPRLIGNRAQGIVIDRQSKATSGIGAGTARIDFQRNDPSTGLTFGRGLAWGQFDIEVIVLRH